MNNPTIKESVKLRENSERVAESSKSISVLIEHFKEDLKFNIVQREHSIESLFLADEKTLLELRHSLIQAAKKPNELIRRKGQRMYINHTLIFLLMTLSG